uniref:Lef-1 protein n=1 Tax=Autographa californica nuclear polyhedrosis virus TaxID=46015 RepID=Q65343_NPVAC|nr:5.7 kDa ORF [Autographa californica nucleopolyhedrovirus]
MASLSLSPDHIHQFHNQDSIALACLAIPLLYNEKISFPYNYSCTVRVFVC